MPFVIRPFVEPDFEEALRAMQAAEVADSTPERTTAADLRFHLADSVRRPEDQFVAVMPGAGVVAFALAMQRDGSEGYFYLTDGAVHPAWRRRGIGRALLQQHWQRVQAVSAGLNRPVIMAGRAFPTQTGVEALFSGFDMTPLRYFFEMRRSLAEPLPALELPAHLTLRTWSERRADEAIWRALNEAFADHWNHAEMPFAEFMHRQAQGRANADASFVVWDGDEVAGVAINDMGPDAAARRGNQHGWISMLSVRRPWRQQGLGRGLLIASLQAGAALGHPGLGLHVDAANLTGAVRLYEGVGFRVTATRAMYHRAYP